MKTRFALAVTLGTLAILPHLNAASISSGTAIPLQPLQNAVPENGEPWVYDSNGNGIIDTFTTVASSGTSVVVDEVRYRLFRPECTCAN